MSEQPEPAGQPGRAVGRLGGRITGRLNRGARAGGRGPGAGENSTTPANPDSRFPFAFTTAGAGQDRPGRLPERA